MSPRKRRSRVTRRVLLHAQTALFENGKVLLPKEAPWLHEYVAEITGFPGSRHADQVDSTTQALDHLRQNDDGAIWARLAAKTLREERGG
jgi:predicted phage terminase large subunit-like protein